MPDLVHYMIRRKSDGKLATAGSYPRFNNVGKVWRTGTLKQHLKLVLRRWERYHNQTPYPYLDCEIIQLRIDDSVAPIPATEFPL